MAGPGPSSGRKPFMSLHQLRSPLPMPGPPSIGSYTSDFISAILASSAPTDPGAVTALASTNATAPSLAYGPVTYIMATSPDD